MTVHDSITIQRSSKLRFYPNSVQRQQLAVEFGHARWVWNKCLVWRNHAYEAYGEKVTAIDFSRELTFLKRTYDWLKEVSATVLSQKLRDQDTAFKNFFAGRAKYPKFKKKLHAQSIRYQLDQRIVAGIYRTGEFLRLSKLGSLKLKWPYNRKTSPKWSQSAKIIRTVILLHSCVRKRFTLYRESQTVSAWI
ncbi:MAG: RNA-guided endonuclease InsQ/TnpB family protein [Candidatus Nitrosoglobus sp.]